MVKLRVSYKTWVPSRTCNESTAGSPLIPSCAALVPQGGEKGEKGRILTDFSRCNLGIPSFAVLAKRLRVAWIYLCFSHGPLPPHTPLPLPMLLHTKRDFMSTSLLHWNRDRPQEAEKIIVITQIILSKRPRFLIVHDAGSWTSRFQFACQALG